jgi:hypothetical protein
LFLNEKFQGCFCVIKTTEHNQSNGFFLKEKRYFLCDTQILYQWERPDCFKVAFDNKFLKELEKWVPVRGKKQIFRNWLFNSKFPDFEFKKQLEKKFYFYLES